MKTFEENDIILPLYLGRHSQADFIWNAYQISKVVLGSFSFHTRSWNKLLIYHGEIQISLWCVQYCTNRSLLACAFQFRRQSLTCPNKQIIQLKKQHLSPSYFLARWGASVVVDCRSKSKSNCPSLFYFVWNYLYEMIINIFSQGSLSWQ